MNLLTFDESKKLSNTDLQVLDNIDNKIEFFSIIYDIISNETVQKMKNFNQHCNTTCYKHCLYVAYYSYYICKKLGLDYKSTARAAMLHDLFLYDWRKKNRDVSLSGLHAFVHPKLALENSMKIFDLSKKEQDIILNHMWPLTIVLPSYKESYIVTLVDKYCATNEVFKNLKRKMKK